MKKECTTPGLETGAGKDYIGVAQIISMATKEFFLNPTVGIVIRLLVLSYSFCYTVVVRFQNCL